MSSVDDISVNPVAIPQDAINEYINALLSLNLKMPQRAKYIVEAWGKGFSIMYFGDFNMKKLSECFSTSKFLELKHFDTEVWYLKRKDYKLTQQDWDYINKRCKYFGIEGVSGV